MTTGVRPRGRAGTASDVTEQVVDLTVSAAGGPLPDGLEAAGSFGADCLLTWTADSAARGSVMIRNPAPKPVSGLRLEITRPLTGRLVVTVKGTGMALRFGASRLFNGAINLRDDSAVTVGPDVTCNEVSISCQGGSVRIGRDCMLSSDVLIEAGQFHGLVDLSGPVPALIDRRSDVVIGDHVWLGRGCVVLDRCQIGDGAILGAGAVAAGRYPANVAIVGNPGRVVREQVTWSRWAHEIHPSTHEYLAASGAASGT